MREKPLLLLLNKSIFYTWRGLAMARAGSQKTALEELVERFGTAGQAKFYVEQQGTPFGNCPAAHDAYQAALDTLRQSLPSGVRFQFVERSFLPNFLFGERDRGKDHGVAGQLCFRGERLYHGIVPNSDEGSMRPGG